MSAPPLIVTLAVAAKDLLFFERLRRLHFPPERNFIPAHLTLFHHLPGDEAASVQATLRGRCREQVAITAAVTGLRLLGRGVAFTLASPELAALRAGLADVWGTWLTAQDRQRFQPHITVQNKVAVHEARMLFEELQAEFSPFEVQGEGLSLWRYHGGPWEAVETFPFQADARMDEHRHA